MARAGSAPSPNSDQLAAQPAVQEGQPALERDPSAGDRMPDARIARDGPVGMGEVLAAPRFHLLLCGRPRRLGGTPTRRGAQPLRLLVPGEMMLRRLCPDLPAIPQQPNLTLPHTAPCHPLASIYA
jgi:hypothetical protein